MSPRPNETARLDGLYDQMLVLRDQGLSYAEVGERLGCSAAAVRHRVPSTAEQSKRTGHGRPKGTTSYKEQQTAEMWTLWVRGVSHRQIAEQYKLSPSTVGSRLRAYRETLPETARETIFRREMDLLDELRRRELAIFYDNSQEPMVRLAAADRVMKGMERLAKMMGLDRPTDIAVDQTVRYEIVSVDPTCHS